ncbi:hypothetical protein IW261DRAFT_1593833 [Armillaria novae-zelandiae]|uniref:Uncharacterized protein n=1 Tax=Armillaria novae-zelandiae TaxID=153914 RepID=A0AA39UHP5_9AGAR|nr:hypothetical protein IW261DRAFT_1593833 [Armillaria novae-zelandiae]
MSTRASMSVLGLGASIEAPGIRPPFLAPTLVEFSRTLIHLEPDTKTNVSWQVIVYLHMFVVLSGELAWTLRNRAQSHVAVNFKCIFKYARSSEEVRKPQDHIPPSGKPWHKYKSSEANPTLASRTRVKLSRAETFQSQSHGHFDTFKNVEVETYGGSKTMVKEDPAPSILQV